MTEWDIFPFEGDFRVKELGQPVLLEPPRSGEPGGPPCDSCTRPDEHYLWVDDDWRVVASPTPTAVPFVILETRLHHDLSDLPHDLSTRLGPTLQRIEAAFLSTGRVGRVHVNRWGDGGAHFHIWLFGRRSVPSSSSGRFFLSGMACSRRWSQTTGGPCSTPSARRCKRVAASGI